ncbi:thioesterase family protein [Sedimentibacter sp. zth1]|uniref:thioesterase family protein n=1 Tax=Sedimentibacter sp. zth1 TaxID=2816908 RepID=UPI001A912DC0|nr:thioesterase family protein [Sedimentibacter sp. zth1]QSX05504.1 thioesterase family protein [Sedimentibacter sp. zth1]
MELKLKIGLTNKFEKVVTKDDSAIKLGSGTLEVFSTPMMVAMMECASKDLVQPFLPEGFSTVGIGLNIKHIAATKVGKKVWAIAKLVEIDRKRLVLSIEAFDEDKKIGEGTHERYIVENEKFIGKL